MNPRSLSRIYFNLPLCLCFPFLHQSHADRLCVLNSDIGNAFIAGMDDDLQSYPKNADWYEWALTGFYMAYIAFEWMSLLWKVIPAHVYITIIVMSWGLVASLQAVATSYPMLIVLRTLLGIGEAGFTGIPFYLSFFFKRDELAFRTAVFISGKQALRSIHSIVCGKTVVLSKDERSRATRNVIRVLVSLGHTQARRERAD